LTVFHCLYRILQLANAAQDGNQPQAFFYSEPSADFVDVADGHSKLVEQSNQCTTSSKNPALSQADQAIEALDLSTFNHCMQIDFHLSFRTSC
jgi:hypothetical protein